MMRREFMQTLGLYALAAGHESAAASPETGNPTPVGGPPVDDWRRMFPALSQRVNGHRLIYMDTAATSLRPRAVIDAVSRFYETDNANPGGALHTLARRANDAYEGARKTVASHIGASSPGEVVFTRGTTEGLNLVAAAWGGAHLKPGDEILIGLSEHSSNMVPWQLVARRTGATLQYFGIDAVGHPALDDMSARLNPRTKIVAFSHVSNVLGMVNPAREMCTRARAPGRIVVIDAAQSVPHFAVNVQDLGCDFMAFSSHKMLGPMGVGVLWGRRALLEQMPPYQGGSNMAHDVDLDSMHLSDAALKFGAGTPNVAGPVGLAAAIRVFQSIGHDAIWKHEQVITRLMIARLGAIPGVRLLGSSDPAERISVFAFTVEGRQPAEIVRELDKEGIAIRAGDLASLPLLRKLGTERAARASCYLYTTTDEVERFAEALRKAAAARPS